MNVPASVCGLGFVACAAVGLSLILLGIVPGPAWTGAVIGVALAVVYLAGVIVGRADAKPARRTDEASRFDVGDLVTFSDGSTLRVVATNAPAEDAP